MLMKASRHWFYLSIACGCILVGATLILLLNPTPGSSTMTSGMTDESDQPEKVFHIVTGEFKTTNSSGEDMDIYIFNPAHLSVNQGDSVTLMIHGVNGAEHHFRIEAFGVSGTVKRGETTKVTFTADQAGTFELLCDTHSNKGDFAPMVGYITVLE